MLIFPVRHHSPAAARQVERLIRQRRPRAVLIEGPADATPLIPLLLAEDTVPPVALYAYRTDGVHRAAFDPFCAYSPEYVALRVGREVGARLAFCDLPAAVTLGEPEEETAAPEVDAAELLSPPAEERPGYPQFAAALAEAAGFESFEAFWEAAFEQEAGAGTVDGYVAALADFGGKVRGLLSEAVDGRDEPRERHMAAAARALIAEGMPAEEIVLVCGAAHAAAIAAYCAADAPPPEPGPMVAVEMALIPYSFPRLSEQAGYGAGNRAPWFYQQVWAADGDYAVAGRRALVTLARHLRQQGYAASAAQCIDAYTLARLLAELRTKAAPGVDEVAEAAVACLGQGQTAVVEAALRAVLIGETAGRITARAGRTPLQAEFYATTARLRLPVLDAPRQVLLHLTDAGETEGSVFLHRLATAEIPFARELEGGLGGRGRTAQGGPLESLARAREKWELQWTPATDAALIERTAWGGTLEEVCGRRLGARLAAAERIDEGTAVLLRLALCDLAGGFPAALARCEGLAADSGDFAALARATYHLDGLLTYGAARRLPTEALTALAGRLFARAVLHLPADAVGGDEAAQEVQAGLISLYELVARRSPTAGDPDAFWAAVALVAEGHGSHPGLRGLALVLLELGGRLEAGELTARLRYWLSAAAEAADNARLVAGLFSLHRGTLIRNRALIGAVTEFLTGLELEKLTPLLPTLRRTLGSLSPAERSYLSETLAAVLGVTSSAARQALTLTPAATAWLREADAAVAATLTEWREHYGID